MATKSFEEYFDSKPVLSGPQPTSGDKILVLRSGTVFGSTVVDNKAYCSITDNSTPLAIAAQGAYVTITGWVEQVSTPTLTFAADQWTYSGPSQIVPATLTLNLSFLSADPTPGNKGWSIGIFANDTIVGNYTRVSTINDSDAVFLSCSVQRLLTIGDVIDFRVQNRTDTADIVIKDAQALIS